MVAFCRYPAIMEIESGYNAANKAGEHMIKAEDFGMANGHAVTRYWLENAHKTRVAVLSYAGIVQEYSVLHAKRRVNLVTSLSTAQAYWDNPFQLCKQIGRVAGRIARGQFYLGNDSVQVPTNEKGNTLHGGPQGMSTQFYAGTINGDKLQLETTLTAANDGFPGDVTVTITYQLLEDDTLQVDYQAIATANSVFDPTLHIYFNLGKDFGKTRLWLPASERLEVDAAKLPTGAVVAAPRLFTHPQTLEAALDDLKVSGHNEIDDAFWVEPDENNVVAHLKRPDGITVQVKSRRNGLVVFTANPLAPDNPYDSLALEAQTLPDAVHHTKFGNVELRKGTPRHWRIAYSVLH